MRIKTFSKISILIIIVLLIGCQSEHDTNSEEPLQVFLVRHAEKTDHSKDAKLSVEGIERALILAGVLKNADIEYVHSSNFIRTRDTASPTAKAQGLEVELYDHGDIFSLAEKLKKKGGRHLVVGHSGSTPSMVELLEGKPGEPINEENEYDRLYIVTIGKDNSVNTILLRYGKLYIPE